MAAMTSGCMTDPLSAVYVPAALIKGLTWRAW